MDVNQSGRLLGQEQVRQKQPPTCMCANCVRTEKVQVRLTSCNSRAYYENTGHTWRAMYRACGLPGTAAGYYRKTSQ